MKIFIVGLPNSGLTTVSQKLADSNDWFCINATQWIGSTFRSIREKETSHHYDDEFQQYLSKRRNINPNLIVDHVSELCQMVANEKTKIIEGVGSPHDFIKLFDYTKDVVVFLNRIGNEHEFKDHENIGISVIREYCFWMSAAGVLQKDRWLEYNFRIPGEESDYVKTMGAQNTVIIVKSFEKLLSNLNERLRELLNAVSR